MSVFLDAQPALAKKEAQAKIIFVVDDSPVNLTKAKRVLEDSYRVLTLLSAAKMFALLERVTPDIILLDIEMPEMDGFATLQKLKKHERTKQIPVIFLTGSGVESGETRGLELGAVDFVQKPFSDSALLNRISRHLHIADLIIKRTKHIERLQNSILSVLADMVESRDEVTGGHTERTTSYVNMLLLEAMSRGLYASEMRSWDLNVVVPSARLHDVGKIAIPDLILNKPGELTKEEFEIIKNHAKEGENIIDKMIEQTGEDVFLSHAKLFAGYHHERWDGRGYPYGLKGKDIPLQGRIMAIADVYDALTSVRPYKRAFSHEEAVKIIMFQKGKHFDPEIADVFFKIQDTLQSEAKKL